MAKSCQPSVEPYKTFTTHKPVSPWTWLVTSLVHMLLKYLSWNLKILKTEIFVKSNIPINEIMPALHILYLYGEKLSTIRRTLQDKILANGTKEEAPQWINF